MCVVLGTWQLILLVAALRHHGGRQARAGPAREVFLVHREISPSMRELIPKLLSALRPGSEMVWADDLFGGYDPFRSGPRQHRALIGRLRDRLGGERVGEIWISKLWDHAEKTILEALPGAPLYLYEDGLHDYLPRPVAPWTSRLHSRALGRSVKATVALLRGRRSWVRSRSMGVLLTEHLARVAGAYFSLAEDLPLPAGLDRLPWTAIGHDELRAATRDASRSLGLRHCLNGPQPGPDVPTALVLGQCFATYGGLAPDEELLAYVHLVRRLIGRGYHVLWKDHPRVTTPQYDLICAAVSSDRLCALDVPPACPIELITGEIRPQIVVSTTSSALFYLPKVHDLRTYYAEPPDQAELQGDFAGMMDLVKRHALPIEELIGTPTQHIA